jgi:hypothetical protein
MAKDRATIGIDGLPLPILPPGRDARVWARLVRIMFYLPGFMGLPLIKAGEPASFGITVELLMLSSAAAIVAGLYIGTESAGRWSSNCSALVPFLAATPPALPGTSTQCTVACRGSRRCRCRAGCFRAVADGSDPAVHA